MNHYNFRVYIYTSSWKGSTLGKYRGGDDQRKIEVPSGFFPGVQMVQERIPADEMEHQWNNI